MNAQPAELFLPRNDLPEIGGGDARPVQATASSPGWPKFARNFLSTIVALAICRDNGDDRLGSGSALHIALWRRVTGALG